MKAGTESTLRDDLMGMTIAVLMFVLQGCMVLAISSNVLAGGRAVGGPAVSDQTDAGYLRVPA
jgi:hypothetical protein